MIAILKGLVSYFGVRMLHSRPEETPVTPQDWTLLVIAAAGDKPLQPVQLQKSLFLLGEELSAKDLGTRHFYAFTPYDYGPFCAEAYSDAEVLEAAGLVTISRPPETRYRLYVCTDQGAKRAAELRASLAPSAADYLARVVAFTQSLTFNELVTAVYKAYPAMKKNSVFQQ